MAQQPLSFRGDDRAAVARWWPATVPGAIQADLVHAGWLPDLYGRAYGPGQARWVEGWDWWLERDCTLALRAGERGWLHFSGIASLATVWLDGRLLAFHEGSHAPLTVEITTWLDANGELHTHRIAVRLWGAAAWPLPAWRAWERVLAPLTRLALRHQNALQPFHPRLRWLHPPVQAGWDFAPRLLALGLWDEVTAEGTGSVAVEAIRWGEWVVAGTEKPPQAGTHACAPWGVARSDLEARTEVELLLDATAATRVALGLHWEPANFQGARGEATFDRELTRGQNQLHLPLHILQAHLWQPWEQGPSHLYHLTVTVTPAGAEQAETAHRSRFGIRTVHAEGLRLTVNGQPFFARAINWVPADILPGTVPHDRYARLLGMARERGVNFVRVWGGGGRERRDFYELCDELGLLVWQEFPFACAFLDHFPRDGEFLDQAERQARGMVRILRAHPSLALWGAGNEFSPRRNRPLLARLARVVAEEDARPFVGPSPGPGDRHAWHVWHGLAPLYDYTQETASFVSELGLQAPPAQVEALFPADAAWPPERAWATRHADVPKLRAYVPEGEQADLSRFVAASQAAQAWGVQAAVERMRRRKAEGAAGVAVWQWNEPWPAVSWALVDFIGQPKVAAEGLRDWYAPLLLSLDFDRRRAYAPGDPLGATLWAINDWATGFEGCQARLECAGQLLWTGPLTVPPHSARPVATLSLQLPTVIPDHDPTPLRVELWQGDMRLAQNGYPLALPGLRRASPWRTLYRTLVEWVLRW